MITGHSTSLATSRPRFPTAGATRSFLNHTSFASSSGEHSANSGSATVDESKPWTSQTTVANCTFGPVPSRLEVEKAIHELQRFMNELQSKMVQAPGYVRLCDAFSTLQTEPDFQNMVISISCDKAVWQAIQSNDVVRDLQRSVSPAEEKKLLRSSEEPDITNLILRWVMEFAKSKILELIEKFGMLVNEMLNPTPKEKLKSEHADHVEEKIRSSLLLSVIILMVVIVARTRDS